MIIIFNAVKSTPFGASPWCAFYIIGKKTQEEKMTEFQNSFKKGLKDGLPIALGYLSVLISMTNLTSAGQFAGLDLILAGGAYLEMALTQLVINIRYALMSVSLSQKLHKSVNLLDRFLIAFSNTDEIFAVASGQKGEVGKKYMYGLALLPIVGWTLGTLIGAAASTVLPLSVRSALGIAIYGMFIAIFIPPAKHNKTVAVVVLLSAALSICFKYVPGLCKVSSGFVIIICAVLSATVGALLKPVKEDEANENG